MNVTFVLEGFVPVPAIATVCRRISTHLQTMLRVHLIVELSFTNLVLMPMNVDDRIRVAYGDLAWT